MKANPFKAVTETLEVVKQFSADEMQVFLSSLGSYFYVHADELANMDAEKISIALESAATTISERTGN